MHVAYAAPGAVMMAAVPTMYNPIPATQPAPYYATTVVPPGQPAPQPVPYQSLPQAYVDPSKLYPVIPGQTPPSAPPPAYEDLQ